MIKVKIEESGVNFTKNVGSMNPKQIDDFVKLIKEHGVMYQNEKYYYFESFYDADYDSYLIVVDVNK